jgi:NAD-dependent SIR2 family protein deacetylase
MHPSPYPTQPIPASTQAKPEPALHLLGGIWVASCPMCGFQLATARTQARVERRAARRVCPVCHQAARP